MISGNFLDQEGQQDNIDENQKMQDKESQEEPVVFTKDTMISEVIQRKPRTIQLLMMVGLGCVGCPVSLMETIEQGAIAHGIDPDILVEKLNEY